MAEPTKTRSLRAGGGVGLMLGLLISTAACSGGGGGGAEESPPAALVGAERFGAGFAAAFNKVPHSDPINPSLSDIIPLSYTTDPFEVP